MSVSSRLTCQLYAWVSIDRMNGTSRWPPLRITSEGERWILEQRLDRAEELGGRGTVDRPMVDGQRHGHHRPDDDLAVLGHGPVLGRADGEDRGLRRVEHGDELLNAEHA